MKWMKERDLLIAQTMAFVESVTGKKPAAEAMVASPNVIAPGNVSDTAGPVAGLPDIEALMTEALEPPSAPPVIAKEAPQAVPTMVRADLRKGFQSEVSEIKARVATFRAHQERFTREREDYSRTTMAKVQATLREMQPGPRTTK